MFKKTTSQDSSSLIGELSALYLSLAFAYTIAIAPGFFSPITWGLDDAAMYLRYLKNFEAGYGLAWNRGEAPVYGLTSLLYFAALLGIHSITGLTDQLLLVGSSWAFGALGLVLLALIAHRLSDEALGRKRFILLALVICPIAFHPYFRHLTLNGMESTLAMSVSSAFVLGLLHWVKARSIAASIVLAALGYLLFLVRPDCLVYALCCPMLFVLRFDREHRARPLGAYLSSLALLLLVDTAAKTWLFGDPLPLPFYVKQQGFYQDFGAYAQWESSQFLLQFLLLTLPLVLLGIYSLQPKSKISLLIWLLPVIAHALYLSSAVQIMGYFGRLYLPALPFIAGWAICEYQSSASRLPDRGGTVRFNALRCLTLLAVACGVPWLVVSQPVAEERFTKAQHMYPQLGWHRATIGMYRVLQSVPDSVSFAATEHGFLGAQFPARAFFDLSGLHNPSIAKRGFQISGLLRAQPSLIWFPPEAYRGMREQLQQSSEFNAAYCVFPDLFDFGVAYRKDAPEHAEIVSSLQREFAQSYAMLNGQTQRLECN